MQCCKKETPSCCPTEIYYGVPLRQKQALYRVILVCNCHAKLFDPRAGRNYEEMLPFHYYCLTFPLNSVSITYIFNVRNRSDLTSKIRNLLQLSLYQRNNTFSSTPIRNNGLLDSNRVTLLTFLRKALCRCYLFLLLWLR